MQRITFKILTSILLFFVVTSMTASAQGTSELFAPAPSIGVLDKGNNAVECAKGVLRFIASPKSNLMSFWEDFKDYWRDFLLWPSHYADVAIIEDQWHTATRELFAAFVRCDANRIKSLENTYWRLYAELFFVRHFVETEGGYLHVLTEKPEDRESFKRRMLMSFVGRGDISEDSQSILFSGYFDLFEAKYKDRAKTYASFGNDPAFTQLKDKVMGLFETVKSLQDLATEEYWQVEEETQGARDTAGNLKDEDLVKVPANAIVEGWENKGTILKEAGSKVLNTFKVCPEGDPDSCKGALDGSMSIAEAVLGAGTSTWNKMNDRKTFEQVQIAISQEQIKRTEDKTRGEMFARYELLYGRISGDGVAAINAKMDKLIETVGPKEDKGSLPALKKVGECAKEVQEKVCK